MRALYVIAVAAFLLMTIFFGVMAYEQRFHEHLPQPTDATMLFFLCLIMLIMLIIVPLVIARRAGK